MWTLLSLLSDKAVLGIRGQTQEETTAAVRLNRRCELWSHAPGHLVVAWFLCAAFDIILSKPN